MSILLIVMAIASSALYSLTTSANRNQALVDEEQSASNTLAQISRDIRSTTQLTVPASQPNQIDLTVASASGSTNIEWVYDSTSQTLTREVASGASFAATNPVLQHVANPSGHAVFTFYDDQSNNITATTASNIGTCSTAIQVQLYVSSGTSGVATYQESDMVALTNQVNVLTAPGNGYCHDPSS